ncbi:MAG: mechanosensitive ion channel family protein [Treponemataceae bacterium]
MLDFFASIFNYLGDESSSAFEKLSAYFTLEVFGKIIIVIITLVIYFSVYAAIKKTIKYVAQTRFNSTNTVLINKFIKYMFALLIIFYFLNLFGIDLSAIWGAAGVAGIAIGFAAQTSFSNIISGFFVFSDRAIKIGDFITVEDVTGTVQTMDLLSVKILTPDNQSVRIPNEKIIQSNLINTTYFSQRRITIRIGVSYDSDLREVMKVLLETAADCDFVLKDPEPIVLFDKFADSSIEVICGVWFKNEDFRDVKNEMYIRIHESFKKNNIQIAFPQMDIHFDKNKKDLFI